MTPTHEMLLRSMFDSRANHERKIRNAGRLVLACVIIIPSLAVVIYQLIK